MPYLGSVKLQRELPEGIPYEVRIKQENGAWWASVNYWKPPVDAEEKTHLCGAVDVGITPLAVDSELVHYDNPKALYRMLAKLQRWQRTLARRTVGSRGWHEAQGRINAIHRRINGLRENAHHQVSRQLVRKYAVAIESLNVAGMEPSNCPIRPRPSVMRPAAACSSRSVTRQTGTELSSWQRTGSIRRANSAPTAALTMRVWGGNCTGPAHSAAGDTIATKMPRSTC